MNNWRAGLRALNGGVSLNQSLNLAKKTCDICQHWAESPFSRVYGHAIVHAEPHDDDACSLGSWYLGGYFASLRAITQPSCFTRLVWRDGAASDCRVLPLRCDKVSGAPMSFIFVPVVKEHPKANSTRPFPLTFLETFYR